MMHGLDCILLGAMLGMWLYLGYSIMFVEPEYDDSDVQRGKFCPLCGSEVE